MRGVFADTAFYLALINPRDQFHRSAVALNDALESPMVTTAWVMLEFANALAESRGRERFAQVIQDLRSEADVTLIEPEQGLFDRGCQLYGARADKEWSLTDCISFCVMKEYGLAEAPDARPSSRPSWLPAFDAALKKAAILISEERLTGCKT